MYFLTEMNVLCVQVQLGGVFKIVPYECFCFPPLSLAVVNCFVICIALKKKKEIKWYSCRRICYEGLLSM